MDYLQYYRGQKWGTIDKVVEGFKPCYKWITFNTKKELNLCVLLLREF